MRFLIITFIISLFCFNLGAQDNEWANIGPPGARVMTIEIDPFDNQKLYLGTVENGMYKSSDGGNSWEHIEGLIANLNIREIRVHPLDPDTIYAATVDGLYKSANTGQSWSMIEFSPYPLNEVRALLVHPTHPNIIIAGGPSTRRISTDGGVTWGDLNTGVYIGIDGFAYDPQNENILYFASGSMPFGMGVWKSEDMGQSWFSIQNNLDSTGFGEAIAVDPFNSNILYFVRNDFMEQSGRVVSKSTNGGSTWFDITPNSLLPPPIVQAVAVSPLVQNMVFICAHKAGILRSTNGGAAWESLSTGPNSEVAQSIKIDPVTGILYLGTLHDGIYKSTDNGDSWEKISDNINLTNCNSLAFDNGNENRLFVLTSNWLYSTSNTGQTWEIFGPAIPATHRVRGIKTAPEFTNLIYACTAHSSGSSRIDSAGFYRSTDSGETWEFYNDGLPPDIGYYKIAISVSGGGVRRLFLASSQGLYYSNNEGESWDLCSIGLPVNSYYNIIDVAPSNPDFVVVGDLENNVFRSSNQGDSWAPTGNIPGGNQEHIIGLKFDPMNENIIYVSNLTNGLYKSYNFGSSWSSIINNLPIDPDFTSISPILINPLNSNNIFVCSYKRGVYQSHDGGDSWEPFNNGLDTVIYFGDMIFAPGDTNTIVYASGNKSAWTITRTATNIRDGDVELPSAITLNAYPNPFNAQTAIEFDLPRSEDVTISVYDILGRKVLEPVSGEVSAGRHSVTVDMNKASSGVYFYILKTDKCDIKRSMLLLK